MNKKVLKQKPQINVIRKYVGKNDYKKTFENIITRAIEKSEILKNN